MPRGSSARQKDLFTQLKEATTPEERDRIVRRMRHAEVGQEGERGRVLDGLIVNGRDPYADLRGAGRPVYEETERSETRMVETETKEQPAAAGLSITEVAARVGVDAWKIRDLEAKGRIGPIARPNGKDREYSEDDLVAIGAALAAPQAVAPQKAPAPAARAPGPKRAMPTVSDRRHEIIYCPECRRQLRQEEYAMEVEDVVMTDHGGITRTLVTCFQHKVIALKTEFIIRAKRAEPAS